MQNRIKLLKSIIMSSMLIIMLLSCENRIEDINSVTDWNKLPVISAKNVEILYSDSAIVKAKLIAKELYEHEKSEDKEAFVEFPKGLEVFFYNNFKTIESKLSCKYAIYNKSTKLFESRNDVEIYNYETKEKLNTEQMFWDEEKEIIYSDHFTRITRNTNDVTYGENGFISDQTFTSYTIIGGGGTYYAKEDSVN